MWPLKTILYCGIFWAGCALALIDPIFGVVNYMIVYQTDPTITWWGKPLYDLGIRFSLVAALFTMAGMLFARKRIPLIRPSFGWWECGVLALFATAVLNAAIGYKFGPSAMWTFEKFWKVLLFTLILGRLAASRRNLWMVIWTLVGGCLYIGYDAYTAPEWAFVYGRLERVGGPDFSTTSGAAAHLSAMLPFIGAAFLSAKHWPWKIAAATAGAFTVNAIVLCRTRSAFVGLVIGALVAFLVAPRGRRWRIHALLITGAALSFTLTDEFFWERMATLTDKQTLETDRATVSRKEIWIASIQILRDHPLGIGVGNFPLVIGKYDPRHYKRATHNSLIVCFVELGVQGGIVFLMLVAGSVVMLYRTTRLADQSDDPLETKLIAYGMLVSLVTYFITSLGTQRFYCESFWWVLVLPLALHRLVVAEIRAKAEEPELAEERAVLPGDEFYPEPLYGY